MWIILSLISVLIQKSERPVLWEKDPPSWLGARRLLGRLLLKADCVWGGSQASSLPFSPPCPSQPPAFLLSLGGSPGPPCQRQAEGKQDGGGTEGRKVLLF